MPEGWKSGIIQKKTAPGRTEISGNHTDHQHGCVLAAAVDLETTAEVTLRPDSIIRVASEGYAPVEIDLNDLSVHAEEKNTTAALVRGVAAAFAQRGCKLHGFDAAVRSTVLPGSGLSSSAAFEVLIGTICNELFFDKKCSAIEIAQIGQYAENVYFGKPCGLLDQLTSAVGGVIFADFADPKKPRIEKIHTAGVLPADMTLCVTDTRGSHSELTGEFAAIRHEMESVAACLGGKVLGQVKEQEFWTALLRLRRACGDRAVLRAVHYFEENARALAQRNALVSGDFNAFLQLILESGHASFALCQNVYCSTDVRHQGLSVALALSQTLLEGQGGAWRMQGGGFAGTIQAFVPGMLTAKYHDAIEKVFGAGSCYLLRLREQGALRVI